MKQISTLEKYAVLGDWYFLVEEHDGVYEGWIGHSAAGANEFMFGMGTEYISKRGFLISLENDFIEAASAYCEEHPDAIQCDELAEAFDYGDEVAEAFYSIATGEDDDFFQSDDCKRHVEIVGSHYALRDHDEELIGTTDDVMEAARFLAGVTE